MNLPITHEPATILAVDDIPKNLQMLGTILRENGYKIIIATSGAQALQLAVAKQPDLILLDIQMPEMDGLQVCRILKSDTATADIPVIFLTARTETDDILEGFQAGAVDYLTKPANPPEMLARVATHIELKRSRDMLARNNDELRAINEGKDKFFSIVAHDLRSPFAGFLGLTQMLADYAETFSPDDLQEFALAMRASAEGLFAFLEDLLQWARAQMGQIHLDPEAVAVREVAQSVMQILGVAAINKGLTLVNDADEHHAVFADVNTVSTILRNLISNAIKFTPKGGEIRVATRADGDRIAISVSDTGVGMSPAAIAKLFQPEHSSSTPGTDGEKGTGLGLLLCEELARRNDGSISAESQPGKGTTFALTLPKPL